MSSGSKRVERRHARRQTRDTQFRDAASPSPGTTYLLALACLLTGDPAAAVGRAAAVRARQRPHGVLAAGAGSRLRERRAGAQLPQVHEGT